MSHQEILTFVDKSLTEILRNSFDISNKSGSLLEEFLDKVLRNYLIIFMFRHLSFHSSKDSKLRSYIFLEVIFRAKTLTFKTPMRPRAYLLRCYKISRLLKIKDAVKYSS